MSNVEGRSLWCNSTHITEVVLACRSFFKFDEVYRGLSPTSSDLITASEPACIRLVVGPHEHMRRVVSEISTGYSVQVEPRWIDWVGLKAQEGGAGGQRDMRPH